MMPTVRVTIALGVALVLLVGLDAGLGLVGPTEVEELPRLEDVDLAKARRVVITRDGDVVTLQRIGDGGNWELKAPVEGPADSSAVREIVKRLRRGVPMQVALGRGNLGEYGLESGKALRLQVFEDEREDAVVDIYIGKDTVGGASFVRFPDDDRVYRAQVGGRHRLDRAPREWRDPSIVSLEPGAATALTLEIGDTQRLRLERGEQGWQIPGSPEFAVDTETVKDVLTRIGGMRAGRVLPSDFPLEGEPQLRVTVERAGLEPVRLAFFVEGELAYVKRDGREAIFQVASSVPQRLALPLPAWRDRQLLDLDRASILRMTWHDPRSGDYVMEQNADASWVMLEPPNVDVNLRDATQAAIRLSRLRAEGLADVTPEEAGFPSPAWVEVEMRGGSTHRVELGPRVAESTDVPRFFVRTPDQPERIGVIQGRELFEIRKGFSR